MNKIGGICYAHQQVGTVHKIYLYDEVKAKGDFNWNTLQYDESEPSANHFREMLEQVGVQHIKQAMWMAWQIALRLQFFRLVITG